MLIGGPNFRLRIFIDEELVPEGCYEILVKIMSFDFKEQLPLEEYLFRVGVITGLTFACTKGQFTSIPDLEQARELLCSTVAGEQLMKGMVHAHFYAFDELTRKHSKHTLNHGDLRKDIKYYLTEIYKWLERNDGKEYIRFYAIKENENVDN